MGVQKCCFHRQISKMALEGFIIGWAIAIYGRVVGIGQDSTGTSTRLPPAKGKLKTYIAKPSWQDEIFRTRLAIKRASQAGKP